MPIEFRDWSVRADLKKQRDALFCFGDNIIRHGLGGQAKEMRGEPNAIGLPTKHYPAFAENSFFTDADLNTVITATISDLAKLFAHLKDEKLVIWPRDGIGTGLAQLQQRAPKIDAYYKMMLEAMKQCR